MLPNTALVAIIDDDLSFREALEGLVKSFGFATISFDSARGFIRSPRRGAASCLIVDIQMPEMSGLELQDCLKRQESATPIIFVTSFPDTRTQSRAISAGAIAFLDKPVDTQQLMIELGRALAS